MEVADHEKHTRRRLSKTVTIILLYGIFPLAIRFLMFISYISADSFFSTVDFTSEEFIVRVTLPLYLVQVFTHFYVIIYLSRRLLKTKAIAAIGYTIFSSFVIYIFSLATIAFNWHTHFPFEQINLPGFLYFWLPSFEHVWPMFFS